MSAYYSHYHHIFYTAHIVPAPSANKLTASLLDKQQHDIRDFRKIPTSSFFVIYIIL
jgi:hypothetical protein